MPRTSVKQSDRKHTWIEQKADSRISEDVMNSTLNTPVSAARADRLLNKWAVERETSLDITTIYRKMKAGTFPQPVRVGKRRVAWRESDIAAWQAGLEVGTRLCGPTMTSRLLPGREQAGWPIGCYRCPRFRSDSSTTRAGAFCPSRAQGEDSHRGGGPLAI